MEWVFIFVALIVGLIVGFILTNAAHQKQLTALRQDAATTAQHIADYHRLTGEANLWREQNNQQQTTLRAQQQQLQDNQQQINQLSTNHAAQTAHLAQLPILQKQLSQWQQDYQDLQQEHTQQQIMNQRLATQLQQERENHAEKLQLLTEAKESLSQQFQVLANQILEEKSKRFTEQNQQGLQQLLNPLQERIHGFSRLVQDTYEKESKERLGLENELKRLQLLNSQLNDEAAALTKALIGSHNKTQGNWGEMILEKVLESSGLRKGQEYSSQESHQAQDDNGQMRRYQPDVLVKLPDNKQIIIDSKVSLTAYVRYTQEEDAQAAEQALKSHLTSIRNHVKELANKRYHDLEGVSSLDFVLMFIPVEPAYLLALQHDESLQQEAFDQRIMLVGPSTLLATLRTIAHIWRSEQQNQNALKIAEDSGKMYDKLVGFVDSLEKIGKNIDQSQQAYQQAMNQLSHGRGNLLIRAEKLRHLGIKANKQLDAKYRLDDEDDDNLAHLPE